MSKRLPAEWEAQSAIQLTWPHQNTDWNYILPDIEKVFIRLTEIITLFQKLIIVTPEKSYVQNLIRHCTLHNILWVEANSNDTWARDHGGINVIDGERVKVLDFQFNGWGEKYPFSLDNELTSQIFEKGVFGKDTLYEKIDFVLEGGAIETDGKGTLLTTEVCLLNKNRSGLIKSEIENVLKAHLGVHRFLWLQHGSLTGDDTDGHIDTLARFVNENTIAYSKAQNLEHPDYDALNLMEQELKGFHDQNGNPYKLVPLPLPLVHGSDEGTVLPATYANFLMINSAVLVPVYGLATDADVLEIFEELFPDRKIFGVNCKAAIKQNGSLHCLTMNYIKEVIN